MTERESDLALAAKRRLGTVLRGKYRLDRLLGMGGMAVVYKATHRNQAEFAVKILHPELSVREDVRTRFLREGYAANSVKHPGAVLVVDDDVAEDGAAFLVMELLDGEGVEALWERMHHRVPPREAAAIVTQLLDVLAAAHAKGIVHRDVKPANLFVTRDGMVKVLDFGIARARDAAASGANSGTTTGNGMLLGTPAFMPPEQALAQSSDIDGQTDVWAAGATLFTLVSGHYVHEGENAPQLMIRAATSAARPVASVAPDVAPAIAQVIDRALAFEKAARWPTATAMRDALEAACAATYGRAASRDVLVGLLRARESSAGSLPSPAALSPSVLASTAASPGGPFDAATTAKPLSSSTGRTPPATARPRRAMPLVVVGATLAVGGFGATLAFLASSAPRPAPSSAIPSATPAAADVPSPQMPVVLATAAATDAPMPPPTGVPTAEAPARAPAPIPKTKSRVAAPVPPTPTPPPPPTAAPPPPPKPASTDDNPLEMKIK
jgi:serine/threonine-protein kinase